MVNGDLTQFHQNVKSPPTFKKIHPSPSYIPENRLCLLFERPVKIKNRMLHNSFGGVIMFPKGGYEQDL